MSKLVDDEDVLAAFCDECIYIGEDCKECDIKKKLEAVRSRQQCSYKHNS